MVSLLEQGQEAKRDGRYTAAGGEGVIAVLQTAQEQLQLPQRGVGIAGVKIALPVPAQKFFHFLQRYTIF